jgi:hypothetical protein
MLKTSSKNTTRWSDPKGRVCQCPQPSNQEEEYKPSGLQRFLHPYSFWPYWIWKVIAIPAPTPPAPHQVHFMLQGRGSLVLTQCLELWPHPHIEHY